MRRSDINRIIAEGTAFFDEHHFKLPEWGYWGPDDWAREKDNVTEIFAAELGWDLCEFGRNNFEKEGLLLFTVRNGVVEPSSTALSDSLLPSALQKSYCEKIMLAQDHQVTLTHYHYHKMEDIINRAGGHLVIQLFNGNPENGMVDPSPVRVAVDGVVKTVTSGGTVALRPGQSITLPPFLYHKFWPENGACMIGEVSLVNDDHNDNHFLDENIGRFPGIVEDEAPQRLLTLDYKNFRGW